MTMDREEDRLYSRHPTPAPSPAWEARVADLFADDIAASLPETPRRALRILDMLRERILAQGSGPEREADQAARRELLECYSEWLFRERFSLMRELYPDRPDAYQFIPVTNAFAFQ